ncbi:MarR family winged helix-turn-helix transcriptional regulator [Nocardioides speluncae]|uniref:MarR family winged helix-turn-helix transcriptional regulator n=1 Tax=Nocardioides speluncae TaxID=2670337 RepID=UPI000D68B5A2|nr:MarR family transcriptional regulator [Nocardioides speluncae]
MRDSVDDHVEAWARELPGLDPLKEQILARMSKIVRHLSTTRSETLAAGELAMWQYKTLLMLRREGAPYELNPSRLAEILGLTRGALSARLTGLEELGLVERRHETGDRRRVRVRLTEHGHAAIEDLLGQEEDDETRLLTPLTEREKKQLAGLLRKVVVALES